MNISLDTTGVIQIVSLLILVLLSAFFSSAETSFSTVNRVRLRTLASEDNKGAIRVLGILDQYGKMLSAVLIGNNIVNLSASSVATTFAIRTWGSHAVGFMTGALTLTILMFGEIVPKTWAMQNAERITLLYSGIIRMLMSVLTPVIFVIDRISNWILRLLHISSDGNNFSITEKELKTIRNRLIKGFHSDNGEENEAFAQKINQYYSVLKPYAKNRGVLLLYFNILHLP